MQAASAIDTLKMSDSPAKKIDFSSADKENVFKPIVGIPDLPEEDTSVVKAAVAPTIKPEEAHEPLLQENSQRFVLLSYQVPRRKFPHVPTCLTRLVTRRTTVQSPR